MARQITPEETKEILSLKREDFTSKKLKELFAVRTGQDNAKFEPNDKITVPVGHDINGYSVKQPINTTVGRLVVNTVMLPACYFTKHGFVNESLDADKIGDIQKNMATMILNDEMTVQEYINYLDWGEFIAMNMAFYIEPSMTFDINHPIKEVIQERDRLFEQYKKEIDAGDPNIADQIEKKLLGMAKEKLIASGNPAYDFFASKEFKFANNYKKTSIMGGAFIHPATKKIVISKENYIDGINARDYPLFSQLTVAGGYARGVSTQDGGYETKKLNSAMQTTVLGEANSDCGTKETVKIKLTKSISKLFVNRYIVENGHLVLLTGNNINKYIDKEVNLRSPMCCKSKTEICSKCAGELFYKLNMPNAGLLTSTFSGSLMNKSMKTIHDASIKFSKIDFDNYIKER